MTTQPAFEPLNRLVGIWTTTATHPALPGVVVHGTTVVEWREGDRFLIHRGHTDHPDFPDSISIIGNTGRLRMHSIDTWGVFRVYDVSIDRAAWRLWRRAPGYSQRFVGTFADDGETIDGHWELCEDAVHWNTDMQITYRRRR